MRVYELNFRGAQLIGVKNDGRIFIPIAPICEAMTIDPQAQRRRIARDEILAEGVAIMAIPFTGGGVQQMLCLPLHLLHYWLAGIESRRIEDDGIRARIIEYKRECADALFAYFMPEYAAATGVKLPTLEARLLHEDLFDREVVARDAEAAVALGCSGQVHPFGYDPAEDDRPIIQGHDSAA